MNTTARSTLRTTGVGVRLLVILTLVAGLAYPLVVTGVAQLVAPYAANGSLIVDPRGQTVGSLLIAQPFVDAEGNPLPEYFQPRPSAADYHAEASSGSNLAQTSDDLSALIAERRDTIAAADGVAPAEVPADAVTASASGLDPDISAEYARQQIDRVADARGLERDTVADMVTAHVSGPLFGLIGTPTVNVLTLNAALDAMAG